MWHSLCKPKMSKMYKCMNLCCVIRLTYTVSFTSFMNYLWKSSIRTGLTGYIRSSTPNSNVSNSRLHHKHEDAFWWGWSWMCDICHIFVRKIKDTYMWKNAKKMQTVWHNNGLTFSSPCHVSHWYDHPSPRNVTNVTYFLNGPLQYFNIVSCLAT